MKRIIIFVLTAVILLSMGGCTKKKADNTVEVFCLNMDVTSSVPESYVLRSKNSDVDKQVDELLGRMQDKPEDSRLRKAIPDQIRIPAFIVVIATFVTIVQLIIKAFLPALDASLGVFIPLIVVNCIIIGRAEAFAFKNKPLASAVDGLGMGLGFTLAITLISSIRELFGVGTVFGVQVMPEGYLPMDILVKPAGGFIVLGLTLALMNKLLPKKA